MPTDPEPIYQVASGRCFPSRAHWRSIPACSSSTSRSKDYRPRSFRGFRNSIHEIVRLGGTVLIAESELQHVPDYADRIYVIERGEIAFAGTIDQARRDGTVRRVIGDML